MIKIICISLQSSQPDPLELQRQQESRRRALARKRAREQFKPRSPEPVEGRKHIEVQTELYLEEITGMCVNVCVGVYVNVTHCITIDRVEEADVHTQTDAFLDRPPTPLFIPAKTGQDVATQIEEGDVSTCFKSIMCYCLLSCSQIDNIILLLSVTTNSCLILILK